MKQVIQLISFSFLVMVTSHSLAAGGTVADPTDGTDVATVLVAVGVKAQTVHLTRPPQ